MELSDYFPVVKSLMIACLKARMKKGEIVRFVYMKKDGTLRQAVGTLQEQAVQANIVGNGFSRTKGVFTYIDLEKMQWRCFKTENFVGVID